MTGWRDGVSDSRCIVTGTCDTFKMFSFSVMQSTFRFSNVEILAVPTASLIYNFWQLRTVDHILVGKKGLEYISYKDLINRSQLSKVVYKASCWDCQDFYIGKTKRRLHDRKTEHFKGITSTCHASAITDHVTSINRSQLKMGPLLDISKRSVWYPLQD